MFSSQANAVKIHIKVLPRTNKERGIKSLSIISPSWWLAESENNTLDNNQAPDTGIPQLPYTRNL